MIILITGLVAIAAYVTFDRMFPKPKKKVAEPFKMSHNLIIGRNFISANPASTNINGETRYIFECRIEPSKARMADESIVCMKVPSDYIIRTFQISVDSDTNLINWVYLGPNQYHCDKDPKSKCLSIQSLLKRKLTRAALKELMDLLTTYDIQDSLRLDHWDNDTFVKKNRDLIKAIEAA